MSSWCLGSPAIARPGQMMIIDATDVRRRVPLGRHQDIPFKVMQCQCGHDDADRSKDGQQDPPRSTHVRTRRNARRGPAEVDPADMIAPSCAFTLDMAPGAGADRRTSRRDGTSGTREPWRSHIRYVLGRRAAVRTKANFRLAGTGQPDAPTSCGTIQDYRWVPPRTSGQFTRRCELARRSRSYACCNLPIRGGWRYRRTRSCFDAKSESLRRMCPVPRVRRSPQPCRGPSLGSVRATMCGRAQSEEVTANVVMRRSNPWAWWFSQPRPGAIAISHSGPGPLQTGGKSTAGAATRDHDPPATGLGAWIRSPPCKLWGVDTSCVSCDGPERRCGERGTA